MTSPKTESNTSLCNFVWNELDVVGSPMTSVALEFDVWPTTFPQCEAYLMGQSTKRSHCRLSVETWITYSSSLLGQSSQFRKVSNRQTAHLSSGQKSRLITNSQGRDALHWSRQNEITSRQVPIPFEDMSRFLYEALRVEHI